jgi:histone-lysine N-methyltransferase SETD1
MSRVKDRLADFFEISTTDRKTTSTRHSQSQHSSTLSAPSANSSSSSSKRSRLDNNHNQLSAQSGSTAHHKSAPHEDNDGQQPQRVSPDDLLNTVGSASSLSSAASSVFSTNLAASSYNGTTANMASLTPLTNAESSPPSKPLSPPSGKRTFEQMQNGATTSPYLAPSVDSRAVSATITPVQTPPEPNLQARPGSGAVKGSKLIYDPEIDQNLSSKERKKYKPRYKDFGAEVRSTSMRVYLLT